MRIEWLEGFGWRTYSDDPYEEVDLEICLVERGIAIKYWFESLK